MSDRHTAIREGLTFDDVVLQPRYSDFLPASADTATRFSRKIKLNVPVSSAAMDRVTESRLAIALAREGGIGIIHKNMPVERQAEEVDRVKRSESGMIVDPVTIRPDLPIASALEVMRRYSISGVPVTENGGRLVGILTNRDLRFETRMDLLISAVMTRENLITAPLGTTLEQAMEILHRHRIEKLPVVDDHFHLKGLITVKDIQKKIEHPHAAKDSQGRLLVGASIGAYGDFLERAQELVRKKVDVLVIDSAHGYSKKVIEATTSIKAAYPSVDLVVGNVSSKDAALALINAGADAIKVGNGPGSICTTRVVTGAGMPQLTAILDCAKATQEAGIPLIADGGIKFSGDISKAIAAGADSVMIGSLFAGCEESPGETILYQGRTYKEYRGMGSLSAMAQGGAERYGQVSVQLTKLVPEGIEARVPYKGALADLVFQLVGGLKAGMGYCGCPDIESLKTQAILIRITSAGLRESHAHDVMITRESPNYQLESF